MTQRESGQDFDPKHRIVGAIVVVVLAVIFIPMILSNRESPADRPDAQAVAPGESGSEQNKVAVTKLSPPETKEELTEAAAPATPQTGKTGVTSPAPESADPKASAATSPASPTKAPAAAVDTKHPTSGWVVQVGTFSNSANAARLEQKLRARGQPLLVERISLGGNEAVRLRVGPFHDRAAALKAQQRINREVGVKGVVLAYP